MAKSGRKLFSMNLYSRLISIRLSNFLGAHIAKTAHGRQQTVGCGEEGNFRHPQSVPSKKRGRNRTVLLQYAKLEKFFRPHKFNPRFYSELMFRRYPDNLQGRDFYSSRNSWCPHRRVGNNQKAGRRRGVFMHCAVFFGPRGWKFAEKSLPLHL